MKHKRTIRISMLMTAIVAFVCWAVFFYHTGMVELNDRAKVAFDQALEQELIKRHTEIGTIDIHSRISPDKVEQIPEIVSVQKGTNRVEYSITPEKHARNITKSADMRVLHSIALEKAPIIPDSLNRIWQQTLTKLHLKGKTALKIVFTDENKREVPLQTSNYADWSLTDSPLFLCYIGYGCETEITGFIHFSFRTLIGRYVGVRILLCLGLCAILLLLTDRVFLLFCRSTGFSLNARYSTDIPEAGKRIYGFKDDVFYDGVQRILFVGVEQRHLTKQIGFLFEAFLNATDYQLTNDELMTLLWPNQSGTPDRLHQVLSRMRKVLIPVIHIERISPNGYALIIL
ncbi:MAG: hypothetical protein RR471_06565 [Bacteroides sp.]